MSADPGLDSLNVPVPDGLVRFNGDNSVCEAPPIDGRDIFNANCPQVRGVCTIGAVERSIEPQAIDKLRHSDAVGPLKDFLKFLNLSRARN